VRVAPLLDRLLFLRGRPGIRLELRDRRVALIRVKTARSGSTSRPYRPILTVIALVNSTHCA